MMGEFGRKELLLVIISSCVTGGIVTILSPTLHAPNALPSTGCGTVLTALHTTYRYLSDDKTQGGGVSKAGREKLLKLLEPLVATTQLQNPGTSTMKNGVIGKNNFSLTDVTILLDFTQGKMETRFINATLKTLGTKLRSVKTLIAISTSDTPTWNAPQNVHIVRIARSDSKPGSVWNKLISEAKTPVVLVGRGVFYLDDDIVLDRALTRLSSLGVSVVGGAYRFTNGHWFMGCEQSVLRNYSLSYISGYHRSQDSCVFCDHVSGPFLALTHTVRSVKFDQSLGENTIFNDFFLRLVLQKESSVVCPYSMYHVKDRNDLNHTDTWLSMARKWQLDSVRMDAVKVQIPCSKAKYSCSGASHGQGLHPCCLRDLATQIKFLFKTSEEHGIASALYAGTLLGAIKYRGITPWELDADILFYGSPNHTAYRKAKVLGPVFKKAGYSLRDDSGSYKSFVIYKRNSKWKVEWFGGLHVRDLGHEWRNPYYKNLGLEPTKVNLDGAWLRSTGNPGFTMWMHYKPEIYKHSQHNMAYGLSYAAKYKPRPWAKCSQPVLGSHSCLRQYKTDGNIQFMDFFLPHF